MDIHGKYYGKLQGYWQGDFGLQYDPRRPILTLEKVLTFAPVVRRAIFI